MEHNTKKYIAWLAAVFLLIVIVAGATRFLSSRHGNALNGANLVSIVKLSSGGEAIKNSNAGYAFNIPTNWWAEATGGNSVAVYPADQKDQNDATSTPTCKIELSIFDNPGHEVLDDWMAGELRADPTVVVQQQSLEAITLGNASTNAVEWTGTMDGVKTIAVYATNGSKIYEIVPSSLDPENISPDLCMPDFEKLLSLLKIQ